MDPDAYGAKLFNYLGAGCAAISIAMAAETGVLDVLLNSDTPMTSQEIADRKHLKERYVRELMGSLVTAEVIQTDKDSTLYHVPETFKPALKATAPFCRLLPHFGQKFPAVKKCFPADGPKGVAFSSVPDIYDIMDDYRAANLEAHVDGDIVSSVPGLKDKLDKGILVAEFGCATGVIISNLSAKFPASTFTGSDVAEDVLQVARKAAAEKGLKNVTFESHDLYNLPDDINNKFDWIYVDDVIHDLAYPEKALSGIYKALKPGGIFSMIDACCRGNFAQNAGNLGSCYLMTASMMVCLAESAQHDNSAQLGAGWQVVTAQGYLERAGFKVQKVEHSKTDEVVVHFVCDK